MPLRFQSFVSFSGHSSKELTLLELRLLAQLLRVVPGLVISLELRLLVCHMLVLWVHIKTLFPFLALKNQIVFAIYCCIAIDYLGKQKAGNSKKTKK